MPHTLLPHPLQDYFDFEGGNIKTGAARGLKPETQAQIIKWLQEADKKE